MEALQALRNLPRRVRVAFVRRHPDVFGTEPQRDRYLLGYLGWDLTRCRKRNDRDLLDMLLPLYYHACWHSVPGAWRKTSEYIGIVALSVKRKRFLSILLMDVELFGSMHILDILEEVVGDIPRLVEAQSAVEKFLSAETADNLLKEKEFLTLCEKEYDERVNSWLAWGKENGLL